MIRTAPSFSIYLDQDSVLPWVAPWGGDENYTMGLGFQVSGAWLEKSFLVKPLHWIDRLTGVARRHNDTRLDAFTTSADTYAFTLANGGFTPRRIDLAEPVFDDRPYASLLGVTMTRVTASTRIVEGRVRRQALRSELTIGVLGLRLAERIQTAIHTSRRESNQKKDPAAVTPYDPAGWPHQISDGGEPTAKYTVSLTREMERRRWHDFSLQGEASLGYYTNVAVGPVVRFGKRRTGPWGLPNNPLNAVSQALFEEDASSPGRWELYAWAAGRGRLVAYNALMQGAFRDSTVTFDQTEMAPLVREFEAGVTAGWRGTQVTIAVQTRSPEFDVDREPRSHTWGGLYITQRFEGRAKKAP